MINSKNISEIFKQFHLPTRSNLFFFLNSQTQIGIKKTQHLTFFLIKKEWNFGNIKLDYIQDV